VKIYLQLEVDDGGWAGGMVWERRNHLTWSVDLTCHSTAASQQRQQEEGSDRRMWAVAQLGGIRTSLFCC